MLEAVNQLYFEMRNFIVVLLFLFIYSNCLAQAEGDYVFQSLRVVDTVKNEKVIDQIAFKDEVKNSSFFFTESYEENKGLFLFEKKGKNWIVYDYNDLVSNTKAKKHEWYSKRYVSINVTVFRSGMGDNVYGWFILFDLEKKSYLSVQNFSHNTDQDYGNLRTCNSFISYVDKSLKISRICNLTKDEDNYCNSCEGPGLYNITENGLTKQPNR